MWSGTMLTANDEADIHAGYESSRITFRQEFKMYRWQEDSFTVRQEKKRTHTHTIQRKRQDDKWGSEDVHRPSRPGPRPKQGLENIGCWLWVSGRQFPFTTPSSSTRYCTSRATRVVVWAADVGVGHAPCLLFVSRMWTLSQRRVEHRVCSATTIVCFTYTWDADRPDWCLTCQGYG